jgi:hypothetical protein
LQHSPNLTGSLRTRWCYVEPGCRRGPGRRSSRPPPTGRAARAGAGPGPPGPAGPVQVRALRFRKELELVCSSSSRKMMERGLKDRETREECCSPSEWPRPGPAGPAGRRPGGGSRAGPRRGGALRRQARDRPSLEPEWHGAGPSDGRRKHRRPASESPRRGRSRAS